MNEINKVSRLNCCMGRANSFRFFTLLFLALISAATILNLMNLSSNPKSSPNRISLEDSSVLEAAMAYRSGYFPVVAMNKLGLEAELVNVEGLVPGKSDFSEQLYSHATIKLVGSPTKITGLPVIKKESRSIRGVYRCRIEDFCDLTILITNDLTYMNTFFGYHDRLTNRYFIVNDSRFGEAP
jgi:hypothetical protein